MGEEHSASFIEPNEPLRLEERYGQADFVLELRCTKEAIGLRSTEVLPAEVLTKGCWTALAAAGRDWLCCRPEMEGQDGQLPGHQKGLHFGRREGRRVSWMRGIEYHQDHRQSDGTTVVCSLLLRTRTNCTQLILHCHGADTALSGC